MIKSIYLRRVVEFILILAIIGVYIMLKEICMSMYFNPDKLIYSKPEDIGYKYEKVNFYSDGLKLSGYFFPSNTENVKATIVHFHGNAANITNHYQFSAWLSSYGYNVFIFDYRGYGESEGKPSVDGAIADGIGAIKHSLNLPGIDKNKIVVFAQSLGGAIAVASISKLEDIKIKGLVIDSSFYSYKDMARYFIKSHIWMWPLFFLPYVAVTDEYAPYKFIDKIDCPKIFFHSPKDKVVPYSQGRKLYDKAKSPKEFHDVESGHIETFSKYREKNAPILLNWLEKII